MTAVGKMSLACISIKMTTTDLKHPSLKPRTTLKTLQALLSQERFRTLVHPNSKCHQGIIVKTGVACQIQLPTMLLTLRMAS